MIPLALRRGAGAACLAMGLCAATPAAGAPFLVDLGGVRVALDAPPGFSDTTFTGSPRLQEFAEALTPASNRILVFAMADADLRAFSVGDRPELRRYMLAVTPRSLEREWVSVKQFSGFVEESLRELGPSAPEGDFKKLLAAQPYGQPLLLAELRKEREVASVLQGVRLPPKEGDSSETPRHFLNSTTLLWLRSKALVLTVFTDFETRADADWLLTATRRWVEDLRRLNSR